MFMRCARTRHIRTAAQRKFARLICHTLARVTRQARQRGLLLCASRASLGDAVSLLDEEHLQRRILRRRHHAEVPWLVDFAELEFAVAKDLAVALGAAN